MKDYLLLGQNGYLGSYILNNIDCDVLTERNIYNNGHEYKYIINCIGKPNLEYCEKNDIETNYSNALIIEDIKKCYEKSKIINFSSYYVYDDIGLCNEFSNTTIKYAYCRQKILGEKINKFGINLRLGKIFGNSNSSQNKLTEHILKNDNLYIDDVLFNPTSVQSVCKLLKNKYFLDNNFGIFNFSNRGIVSHFDYAIYIIKFLNVYKNITKTDYNQRQFENYGKFTMDISKILKHENINHWEKDMKIFLNDTYKNSSSF